VPAGRDPPDLGSHRAGSAPFWAVVAGLVTIGAGWLLFAYVIIRRTRYVRAHPFDPQS
jgi:hypothetical protein